MYLLNKKVKDIPSSKKIPTKKVKHQYGSINVSEISGATTKFM